MKLLKSTKSKITKDENGENVTHLEITEIILVHCYIVSSIDCHQHSSVLYTFIPNKWIGQLFDFSPKSFIIFTNFNSEFSYIEV